MEEEIKLLGILIPEDNKLGLSKRIFTLSKKDFNQKNGKLFISEACVGSFILDEEGEWLIVESEKNYFKGTFDKNSGICTGALYLKDNPEIPFGIANFMFEDEAKKKLFESLSKRDFKSESFIQTFSYFLFES